MTRLGLILVLLSLGCGRGTPRIGARSKPRTTTTMSTDAGTQPTGCPAIPCEGDFVCQDGTCQPSTFVGWNDAPLSGEFYALHTLFLTGGRLLDASIWFEEDVLTEELNGRQLLLEVPNDWPGETGIALKIYRGRATARGRYAILSGSIQGPPPQARTRVGAVVADSSFESSTAFVMDVPYPPWTGAERASIRGGPRGEMLAGTFGGAIRVASLVDEPATCRQCPEPFESLLEAVLFFAGQPDVDLDDDGLERIMITDDGGYRCIDGNGSPVGPRNRSCAASLNDGFSFESAYRASLVEIQGIE